MKIVVGIELLLPTGDLAEIFEDAVMPMFKQIGVLSKQTEALALARDLLLPRLMNGEIAV